MVQQLVAFLVFALPFLIDSYVVTKYEYFPATKSYTLSDLEDQQKRMNQSFNVKSYCAIGLAIMGIFELIKAFASNRNRYIGMLGPVSMSKEWNDYAVPAINFSLFNVLVGFIYLVWIGMYYYL